MIQPRPKYRDSKKFDCFDLDEPYSYTLSNGFTVTVPEGFSTDFASIPRGFWNIWDKHDLRYRVPAIIHDYLYMTPHLVFSRAFADAEFRRMLIIEGVKPAQAWLFWAAIRIFGNTNWKYYKDEEAD